MAHVGTHHHFFAHIFVRSFNELWAESQTSTYLVEGPQNEHECILEST